MPVFLFVAQWALLAGLGVLVVIMYRQLGRLLTERAEEGELGPAVGSRAAPLTYVRPGEHQERTLDPGDGQPALVAFADPTCPSCEQLVNVLGEMTDAGELNDLRSLVLISDPPSYLRISDVFSSTHVEVGRPVRRDGLDSYRVAGTPLLVAIDAGGVVRAVGSVTRPADVRAFAQSCLLPAPAEALATIPASRTSASHIPASRTPAAAARGDDET